MTTKLLSQCVQFPEGTRLREIVDGLKFAAQVTGAIDGTHIPVIRPQDNL